IIALIGFIGFFLCAYLLGLFQSKKPQAIQALHQQFSDLEFSLELLQKNSKNVAEQLQWERVNTSFKGGEIHLWYKSLGPFALVLVLATGIFSLTFFNLSEDKASNVFTQRGDKTKVFAASVSPVEMISASIIITPPPYTALQKVSQSELEIKAIQGSEIEWVISLSSDENLVLELINSNGDGLEFTKEKDRFSLRDRVRNSGIYALRGSRKGEVVYESDYFPLEAVPDLAPVIQPEESEFYQYHFVKDPKLMNVSAKVSDDFRVKEVFLVATLARGSGENVKFRENRISIPKQNFQSEDLTVKLDLNTLDFKPGDELYYYWAAIDNKLPEPNFSRSDTYFLNYVDSAGMSEEELIGMAIHVMPDYFRSQRQIIIDTQKLLAAKNKLTEREFNVISNEIGYDQKMLRLRYGQYLGEEFEETAGGGAVQSFDSENPLEGFEHRHDEEHEAGVTAHVLLPEKTHEAHEETAHSSDDSGLGGLLDSYLHNHEDEETNTYFQESTKTTLKLALEQMWQSELYLRLFEPDQALPFQEKALEYLKTVQQKSRVYVKRTGFDPPPIKQAEKRLTGDLEELKKQLEKEQRELSSRLAPLAAEILGLLSKEVLSSSEKATIQRFGELWTERMNYSGLEDWSVLLQLQELNSGKITEEGKKDLFQKLYPLLAQNKGTNAAALTQKELERAFWNKLQ
ncbi:MAG: hypothetical protein ABJC55_16665, partial [Algoriphagus sp.]